MATMLLPKSTDAPTIYRLNIDHLSVHYEDRPALTDINLTFEDGQIVCLVGPNGAGKSTLLRAMAGVLPPSHGTISLNGETLAGSNPDVVYVPQRSAVDWTFPISVLEVVMMARRTARSRFLPYGEHDRELALNALHQVSMADLASVQISQLSGGQQQRVFLARALLQGGEVYLLDEPFTGVDVPTQEFVVGLLQDLCLQNKTVVFATHDLEQAAVAADRIVLLNHVVVADGPPEETLTASNLTRAYGGMTSNLAAIPEAQS